MRRNLIYRKRNIIGSVCEVALPILFVYLFLAIKNSQDTNYSDPDVPTMLFNDTFIPWYYRDYAIALQADRVCYRTGHNKLEISGLYDKAVAWQVPFVRCDTRKCEHHNQSAHDFCEYKMLAIAGTGFGGRQRAKTFQQWFYSKYPALSRQRNETHSGVPFDFDFVQIFDSPTDMDDYVGETDYGKPGTPRIGLGIVFDGNDANNYKYWIRQNSTNLNVPFREIEGRPVVRTTPPTDRIVNNFFRTDTESCIRGNNDPKLGDYEHSCTGRYLYNGVLATQRLVGDFILADTGAADAGYFVSNSGVQFTPFPSRSFTATGFFGSLDPYGPLLLTLGLLYPVAAMIAKVVREKELRQKELLKIMGVLESDIGWSWFASFVLLHAFTAVGTTIMSTLLYERSKPLLLAVFWGLVFVGLISFTMALASLSQKSSRGVMLGLLVFFAGTFLTIAVPFDDSGKAAVRFISLHPVAAFSYGVERLGYLEDLQFGLNWETLDQTENLSDLSFMDIYLSLVIGSVLWSCVSFYLARVLVPEHGQALSPLFPLRLSYWSGTSQGIDIDDDDEEESDDDDDVRDAIPIEEVGEALRRQKEIGKSIEIKKLKKEYGDKIAVDGLNLSIYSGQVTAVLGQNGAGKSTTINMLTGSTAPTSGTAVVAGKDIRYGISDIRQSMGICLQHDCLFPQLTVREHIRFFAGLKGLYNKVSYAEAERQVEQSIVDVALADKKNTLAKDLSGGMKRKLSVAIAFCGGSSVVLLDEPTSGMDPFSRRYTWDVIRRYKEDRCIILTTHFMDEAEILGDRIAILGEGQLRCVGSSLFLKKAYGVGYQLTIGRGNQPEPEGLKSESMDEKSCDNKIKFSFSGLSNNSVLDPDAESRVNRAVQDAVPEATVLSDVGAELSYQLPLTSAGSFASMFDELDAEVDNGAIGCYGVSITTLDEVFQLVTRGAAPYCQGLQRLQSLDSQSRVSAGANGILKSMETNGTADVTMESDHSVVNPVEQPLIKYDNQLFTRHVSALLKKRALYFRRDKKAWVCTTILPTLFVFIGFLIFVLTAPSRLMDPLTLDIRDYNPVFSPEDNLVVFNSPDNPFACQPGVCTHGWVENVSSTNELYIFCGFEARLLKSLPTNGLGRAGLENLLNGNCTIDESSSIAAGISSGLESADVSNVAEASSYLLSTSDTQRTSKYGAIWFTHEADSVIVENDQKYSDLATAQCQAASSLLDYVDDCEGFGGVGYVVQYNFTAYHGALMFEALANEALVRHATGNPDFKVEATIAPLPVTKVENSIGTGENAFGAWFLVVLSFPFIGGAFATFVVSEKASKARHLQTVAGVEPAAYWLSTFLWDSFNYQIPLWLTVGLMFLFNVDILTTTEREVVYGVVAILFLYGPASAGFSYCLSFAFRSASMCNVVIISVGFLVGMGGPIVVFILTFLARDVRRINRPELEDIAIVLTWIFRVTPSFCLGNGLFRAINIESFLFLAKDDSLTAFTGPILLNEVYFLAGQCVVYLLLAIGLDLKASSPGNTSPHQGFDNEDDDVAAERERVTSGAAVDDKIVMKNLVKVYKGGKVAVDGLSLGIAPGECFGLLGINGAGKTTTMGMLTGEFPPTGGDATLAGFSVARQPHKIRRRIGYCPQFDAIFPKLTGREHVELYAAIKGVPAHLISAVADRKLTEVGLRMKDADRLSSKYSGGMKRRLSLACATIGQPGIIFLDECSTGVDPVARRDIWRLVSNMVAGNGLPNNQKPTVVLTTHSMDECEALCPRIGIMANGRLRCLGSALHLKHKFGKGFQLEFKLHLVGPNDDDFLDILDSLGDIARADNVVVAAGTSIDYERCLKYLRRFTGDEHLSSMITEDSPTGYTIWRDAVSPLGVALVDLATFVTNEQRTLLLNDFVEAEFPNNVLRERQDTKSRYEVSTAGLKLSNIFSRIEQEKRELWIADYSVSQTSLEQVFNMHAAEAELLKEGNNATPSTPSRMYLDSTINRLTAQQQQARGFSRSPKQSMPSNSTSSLPKLDQYQHSSPSATDDERYLPYLPSNRPSRNSTSSSRVASRPKHQAPASRRSRRAADSDDEIEC